MRRHLLGNCSVNTSPRQRIGKQQSNNFRCYATATRLLNNIEAAFSAWSVTRGYKKDKAKPGLENIRILNLAVVRLTTVEVTKLPL
jgi:hypothetical protein